MGDLNDMAEGARDGAVGDLSDTTGAQERKQPMALGGPLSPGSGLQTGKEAAGDSGAALAGTEVSPPNRSNKSRVRWGHPLAGDQVAAGVPGRPQW